MNETLSTGWQLVALDTVAAAPWRNGGGTTQVLLAWPAEDEWRVRISLAEVAKDGPFSRYPAAERWFAVMEGADVRLRIGGGTQVLTASSEPFHFSGESLVDCALVAGTTRDLNLICLPGKGRMIRAGSGLNGVAPARTLVAGYFPAGGRVAVFGEAATQLAPRTLAWRILEQQGALSLEGDDAIWMEVRL